MITVIFIISIFLFFYLRTKKEWTKQHKEWENIGTVTEESIVTGSIQQIISEIQTYFQHKKVHITTIMIKHGTKQIKVLKRVPVKGEISELSFQKGDEITCIGKWENGQFITNRIEKTKRNTL